MEDSTNPIPQLDLFPKEKKDESGIRSAHTPAHPNGKKQEIFLQDCLDFLRRRRNNSIGTIVTSPPYNIGTKYSSHQDDLPEEKYLNWITEIMIQISRSLKEDGHFFLNIGQTQKSRLLLAKLTLAASTCDLHLQNSIIWVKSISIGGETKGHFKPINSNRFLNNTHETVLHFTPKGTSPINRLAVGVPFTYESNIARFGHEENKRCDGNTWFIPYTTINRMKEKKAHPATFPKELARRCILLADKLEPIFDPFAGSGSTLIAAAELDLEAFGCEIDTEYFDATATFLHNYKSNSWTAKPLS